jgi:hypothetical protein
VENPTRNILNGLRAFAPADDVDAGTRYVPLPRELWAPCGTCSCEVCKGAPAYWDTLAVANTGHTWTVHMPQAQESYRGAAPDWLRPLHFRDRKGESK